MRRVLVTEHGQTLYAKRKRSIESVFGQIKHTAGSDASNDEAEPPRAQNGDWSQRTTTYSKSTTIGSRPPSLKTPNRHSGVSAETSSLVTALPDSLSRKRQSSCELGRTRVSTPASGAEMREAAAR
jgi:hypothetical protein